jgi:hypothetical protein
LKQCIADEITWAKKNKKGAYEEYLATAPKIEQNDSLDQCGGRKEQEKGYPTDKVLCFDTHANVLNSSFHL